MYGKGREVYVVGYPAKPWTVFAEAAEGAVPPAAHEFLEVQRTLFDGAFGGQALVGGDADGHPRLAAGRRGRLGGEP